MLNYLDKNPIPSTAILRPLKNPLFDCEIYDYEKAIVGPSWTTDNLTGFSLDFFVRSIDKPFLYRPDLKKGRWDTNLSLSRQICLPLEFSILGFNFFVEEGASDEDKAAIINGGLLNFIWMGGERIFADIPLIRMPGHQKVPNFESISFEYAQAKKKSDETVASMGSNAEKIREWANTEAGRLLAESNRAVLYPFNVGRTALRIRPIQDFRILLSWREPPKVSRPLRLTPMIEGFFWTPI